MKRILLALLTLLGSALAASAAWQTWDGCTLVADQYFDGDSFQVKRGGRVYVLRLYFIDAPEMEQSYRARVEEQAAFFGVSPAQALRGGAQARAFTERFLARPFRVFTRLQPAPGASRRQRHYAIVERDGWRLDAALVQAGLARVTSEVANFPNAEAGHRRSLDLRRLEEQAAESRRGLWALSQRTDRRLTRAEALRPRPGPGATTLPAPHLVNLNTAGTSDLLALPGIGPKTAAAIIAARPLAGLAALDAVPGLGAKKIAALRGLVIFR